MPKRFGLTAPIGGFRIGPDRAPAFYSNAVRTGLPFGYLRGIQRKHGVYKAHNAARKIQKIFRGSYIRRKYPVKLFAKYRKHAFFKGSR